MRLQALAIIMLFLTALPSAAQTGKLFDADKQMSSSFTSQVYLDRDGFIWVATRNGLNRYDGYQFTIMKKGAAHSPGMASNYVNCLLQDRKGLFYVGMFGNLQTFDGQQFADVKTHDLSGNVLPCYVTCLLERASGEVLVGTSGHGLMRMEGKDNAYQMDGLLRSLQAVHRICEDSRQRLWIASEQQGLLCYDGQTLKAFFDSDEQRSTVRDVCEAPDGTIYIGTTTAGLFALGSDGVPRHVAQTGNKRIDVLHVNRQGHIMIGYDGLGVAIYDPVSDQLTDNPYFSRDVNLSRSKVCSIAEDRRGNIWLGLLQKGIFMQPAETNGFHYMGYKLGLHNTIGAACVTSVLVSSNGYSWIGTDKDGLYCFGTDHQLLRHFKDHFPASILSLGEDRQGRVWAGSYEEDFGWIDTATLGWHRQTLPGQSGISVFDIACDAGGHLWLATMGQGLVRLDPATGQTDAYTMSEQADLDRTANSIANNYISQVSVSPDDRRVYAATTMGVCALELASGSWTSTFGTNCLLYGTPVKIARQFGQKLYIGTNNGLFCYDPQTRALNHFDTETGLRDNGIASIEQDRSGRLWVSTDLGLFCLTDTVPAPVIQSYFVDDGLQSNEFSDGASWTQADGSMVFGGVGGITWFNPLLIKPSQWTAEVRLTAFSVDGEPVSVGTKSGWWHVTDTTVIAASRFHLSHADNTFALQLSTLTYDNPEHIVYRYRVNHEPWVHMQPGVNEITFSHMAPGTYHFAIAAERNDFSTPERRFTVIVHAPWYRSTLAYILYLLALVAAVWLYLRLQHRKEQDRLRMQEHIHAEEMADAKLRFFMNISHEIRTPMTLIISPLQQLIKNDDDPQRRSVYETIRRNAERILHLINQMMDLRKIDKGQMQMRMAETDLVAFIGDIHALFAHQAKARQITFPFEHDEPQLTAWIDRKNFDKVIMNLLSNAFKYTPTGGNITIRLAAHHDLQDGGTATIAISDDGEQIPEDQLEKIFQRFYQVAANRPSDGAQRPYDGTGIGLDLTRSLVELHHGTISTHNLAQGCEFIVTIPLGAGHLKPEEMATETEEAHPATHAAAALATTDSDDSPQPAADSQPPAAASHRHSIVVAEDDEEIRSYLRLELSSAYDVRVCANGQEALTEILRAQPDLVVSDVMMPEMDGYVLCSRLKTNPLTNFIPVILLTAKNLDEDKLEGLETGADDYVVKPFNMDILRRKIVNLINTHRTLRLKYGRNDQLEQQVGDIQLQSPDEKLLSRVMAVINAHLSDSDLSVDMIADEVGISRVHLHRKMKDLTGQTPHNFVRNIRLKQAAALLAKQGMNVTEVMYACGFSNSASFSTVFKSFYGLSPRDYMREQEALRNQQNDGEEQKKQ